MVTSKAVVGSSAIISVGSQTIAIPIITRGIVAGVVFVLASLLLIRTFLGFQEDGTLKPESLIGSRASVYISIAGSGAGQGKVLADTRAGRMELPARTRDSRKLPPGELVEIVGEDGGVLWVARITEDHLKTEGGN